MCGGQRPALSRSHAHSSACSIQRTSSALEEDRSDVTQSPEPRAQSPFQGADQPSRALIDKCVHCGFCLPTCPTYVLWGEEMDSPRGRIYLMKAGLEGRAQMTSSFVQHFDRCLG